MTPKHIADRVRSTSANFDFGKLFFRVRPIRLRPISTSANFDFGQLLDVDFWDDKVWARRVGPEGWRPKISRFFSLLPPHFSFLFLSLGVLSWNFVGVFEGRNPEMCTFGLSGCRVKPRRLHQTGPPGLAHDSPRTPSVAHFRAPALQTPPKFHERTPRERKKKENCGGRREKKARNFGPPTLLGSTLRGPTFSRFGASTL